MGFFSDLKDDLSQAVNELMPEEEADQQEFQQCGLPAAGRAGEGVFAALFELERQVLQDGFLTVLKTEVLHGDGVFYLLRTDVSINLGIIGVDGDIFEIRLG